MPVSRDYNVWAVRFSEESGLLPPTAPLLQVGKKLMLLYIQQQQAEANFTSPACLDQFAVSSACISL